MNVLITGSRGYVGSVLADYLVQQGMNVAGYDAGFFEGRDFVRRSSLSFVKKDIRCMDRNDLKGIDAIVHLAALSNDPSGDLNPRLTNIVNYASTVRLAGMAREAGIRRFIAASSCSVYGAKPDELATESSQMEPLTPYAKSKVESEEHLSQLADKRFSPTFLRSATVYGGSPRMRFDLVVNDFAASAHVHKQVRLQSDGKAWRPLVHVNDLRRAYHFLLTQPIEAVHNQAFNLAECNTSVKDIANLVSKEFDGAPLSFGSKSTDARNYRVDVTKLARLGFKYEWPLERGVKNLKLLFRHVKLDQEAYEAEHFRTVARYKALIQKRLVDPKLFWRNVDESELQKHMTGWVTQ